MTHFKKKLLLILIFRPWETKVFLVYCLLKKNLCNRNLVIFKLALSTYRTQQTMTLDVLQSLHRSLKTCPSTDTLADDPSGLKVKLMDHQKYALNWLLWRESQKPHGGILGKTKKFKL